MPQPQQTNPGKTRQTFTLKKRPPFFSFSFFPFFFFPPNFSYDAFQATSVKNVKDNVGALHLHRPEQTPWFMGLSLGFLRARCSRKWLAFSFSFFLLSGAWGKRLGLLGQVWALPFLKENGAADG